ncbi:hypothetical protein F5876DRAFT_91402 [Lentinula aff. lateritia]|uniref:Uncharacterized protein n=1 Tax=Lentinula aff. lateritia TaxID=2804960 RepID=A0ACC1TLR0_9AGAR|nr:hypothetical protein F5876DRAFT_91402 [Lentinula aff. lateritia]
MDVHQLAAVKQKISESATKFKALHEKHFGPIETSTPISPEPFLPLELIVPPAIHAQVQEYQLTFRAQQIFLNQLGNIMDDYARQFEESWHKLGHIMRQEPKLRSRIAIIESNLRKALQSHFEKNGLPPVLRKLREYAEKHPRPSTPPPAPRQSSVPAYEAPVPFNNEYTPILETYFQYDPYPSSRDRQIIAERSGMTRRQIEVWFQNHRRTARQSGITLPAKRPPGAIAPPGLNVPFSVGQGAEESSGEKKERKARMLDMFNIHSKVRAMPAGQGMSADDPIPIDGAPERMAMITEDIDESRMGMTLTSAGHGISVLEPIDVVERMVREKERKAVEEEMKEERKKYLSVIAPPSFSHPTTAMVSPNPLDSPLSSSPDTLFPAPFARPPAHLQFRYRVAPAAPSSPSADTTPTITGTVRPILPPPTWARLAPPTSYLLPPPPTSTTPHPHPHAPPKSNSKKKPKEKRPTKEDLRLLEESKRLLEIDEAIMMRRLWFCSFDDRVESGTIKGSGGVSTYESIAGGVVEREKEKSGWFANIYAATAPSNTNTNKSKSSKTKAMLEKLGVGLDAATCAYTYVLPKAPFWALVRDVSSSSSSSSSSSTSSFSSSASSSPPSPKSIRKGAKKPAALGPKRRPRNAPSGAHSSSGGFTQFAGVGVGVGRTLNPDAKGKGKAKAVSPERDYRYTSDSSLDSSASSGSSSSSSSSSTTSSSTFSSSSSLSSSDFIPPPVPSVIPQGFPDGFTSFPDTSMAGQQREQPSTSAASSAASSSSSTAAESLSQRPQTEFSTVDSSSSSSASSSSSTATSSSSTSAAANAAPNTDIAPQSIDMTMLNALSTNIGSSNSTALGAATNPLGAVGSVGSSGSAGSSGMPGIPAFGGMAVLNAGMNAGMNMGMGGGMGGGGMGMGIGMAGIQGWSSS